MARKIGRHSNLPLYKFIPFKYIKRIIESRTMPIKRIDGWEDCYENYFLKNTFVVGIEHFDLKKISRRFYGLCFSTLDESDAMWRIYSDVRSMNSGRVDALDNVAIRVRVTPEQLYQLIPIRDDVKGGCYLQRVRYITKDDMEAELLAANPYSLDDIAEKTLVSFFTKRKEFMYEKEVRYIFATSKYHKACTIEMSLNPLALFDEFTIDPRLSRNQYCEVKRQLERLGIPAAKINHSGMYKFESKTLTIRK